MITFLNIVLITSLIFNIFVSLFFVNLAKKNKKHLDKIQTEIKVADHVIYGLSFAPTFAWESLWQVIKVDDNFLEIKNLVTGKINSQVWWEKVTILKENDAFFIYSNANTIDRMNLNDFKFFT